MKEGEGDDANRPVTESAASAVLLLDEWQVSDGIECNGLVARIVAGHVTLAAIYAQIL